MTVVKTLSKVLFVAAVCGLVASTAMAGLTLNVFLAGTSDVKPNGPTSIGILSPTGTIDMEIWARVTGSNEFYTDDGLTKVYASFMTSNGGLVKGDLVSEYLPGVWVGEDYYPNFWSTGIGNHVGTPADLDGDLDLDNGSTNAADANNWFVARGAAGVYKMGTTNNEGWFKLGTLSLELTGWGPDHSWGVTEVWAMPRNSVIPVANVWKEDSVVKGDLDFPTTGQKVTIYYVPEPATLVLMAVGGGFALLRGTAKRLNRKLNA